ncbi:MAG TPA: hypothetical protein VHS59_14635 [Bacillota bacterium]|nr:hypothetical protein [Bacillota bacterium]
MKIRDRFTRGWVAGACGGLLGGLFSFLPYAMGLSTMRITDWSAIMSYGRVSPFSSADQAYALFVLAVSTGFIGIIFAYLLPLVTEDNLYFKGWTIYLVPWWMIYLLTGLAKTAGTVNLSVMTTLFDGIAVSIMGLGTVASYRLLDPKFSAKTVYSFGLPQPAAKPIGIKDGEEAE